MKKIIIVASVVLLMVLGGILYFVISSKEENVMDTYGQNIDIIMNQYPTKVMVLGDKIEFRSQLKYEMVSEITESWYAFEPGKYNGTVLIVNNLCGDVSLTDRDYELIKKGIQNQGVQFIYLGGNLQSFIAHEVWGGNDFSSDELGLAIGWYHNQVSYFSGVYTKEDQDVQSRNKENMPLILVMQIVRVIKNNN